MLTFLGLDLSLTGTGVSVLADTYHGFAIRPPAGLRGVARLKFIEQRVLETLDSAGAVAGIAIEGYAMRANSRQFSLGELGGVIKLAIYKQAIPAVIVPPKTLKMIITGNGNAGKPEMTAAVNEMLGFGIGMGDRSKPGDPIADDNVADAIGLATIARMRFGSGPALAGVPQKFVKKIGELELLPTIRIRSRVDKNHSIR